MLLFTMGCDSDDTITGGAIIPEPELVGCEGTTFYDWSDFEFSTSLDAGATTWLGFEMDETTLFSINLNQPGFHCALFEACDGESPASFCIPFLPVKLTRRFKFIFCDPAVSNLMFS